ncbi:MAG: hypothetical protein RBS17_05325 [Coriobacteriia bacterium]|nr:hypothetical protein [Coriobacteriia bacterium]
MRRTARVLVAVLLATLLAAPMPAAATEPLTGTVVVVLAPYLTWSDITSGEMPRTEAMAASGAVGNMNIRSSARYASELSPTHLALTMSAGAPMAFDTAAAPALSSSGLYSSTAASEVFRRSMGASVGSAEIVYLGLPRILRANDIKTLEGIPGALGQVIEDAGGTTAALGNSDGGVRSGEPIRSRPAAVLAMNMNGLVSRGDVSVNMTMDDATAPYGIRTDIEELHAGYRQALRRMAVGGNPGLIAIDTGDSERAYRYRTEAAPDMAEYHRMEAARTVDEIVGVILDDLPSDGVVMLVSNGQARPLRGPSGFGPVILSGEGLAGGVLLSPSTHRSGLVTDLDVSASILSFLGLDRPVSIRGNAVTVEESEQRLFERVEGLIEMNATAVAVDTVRVSIQTGYIGITVITLIVCALLLSRIRRFHEGWGGRAGVVFRYIIMLLLAMPVSATLMYLVVPRPGSTLVVSLVLAAVTIAVWIVLLLIERFWGSALAVAAIGLGTAVVLLVDQLFGAPLSFSGLFSYSPLLGARYYGIGNEGASIVVGAALAGLGLMIDAKRDESWVGLLRSWGPVLIGTAIVVITAAPFLGTNIAVIAWGTAAFGIMWLYLTGRKMTPGWFLLGVAIVVALVAAFSLYDLAGSGTQTHLGRAWESAESGGMIELWRIVVRKAETNLRVLRATNWSILMVAILAFLAYMRWRPHGIFAETLEAYPAFAIAMSAALWGSLVGYFTEDSGIVIPALVMLYITASLLYLMLASPPTSLDEVR